MECWHGTRCFWPRVSSIWCGCRSPKQLVLERKWSEPAALSVPGKVELVLRNSGQTTVFAQIADDAPAELRSEIPQVELIAPAGRTGAASYTVVPAVARRYRHGRCLSCAIRVRFAWRSAGRARPWQQTVRVYPNLEEARRHTIYLAAQPPDRDGKARTRRGMGREFESLRDYRQGDDFRNICWSATARRGKLVSKTFQVERSQTVWLVVDCGRLMRTRVADSASWTMRSTPRFAWRRWRCIPAIASDCWPTAAACSIAYCRRRGSVAFAATDGAAG